MLLQDVLDKLLQPPSEESINDAIKRLHNIGALDADEVIISSSAQNSASVSPNLEIFKQRSHRYGLPLSFCTDKVQNYVNEM